MKLSLILISGLTTLAIAAPVAKPIADEKRGFPCGAGNSNTRTGTITINPLPKKEKRQLPCGAGNSNTCTITIGRREAEQKPRDVEEKKRQLPCGGGNSNTCTGTITIGRDLEKKQTTTLPPVGSGNTGNTAVINIAITKRDVSKRLTIPCTTGGKSNTCTITFNTPVAPKEKRQLPCGGGNSNTCTITIG